MSHWFLYAAIVIFLIQFGAFVDRMTKIATAWMYYMASQADPQVPEDRDGDGSKS